MKCTWHSQQLAQLGVRKAAGSKEQGAKEQSKARNKKQTKLQRSSFFFGKIPGILFYFRKHGSRLIHFRKLSSLQVARNNSVARTT